MKLFLTFTLLVSAFACMNADNVSNMQEVYKDFDQKMTALRSKQAPLWKEIGACVGKENESFAKQVEAAAEEVRNGDKDLDTAKEELYDVLRKQNDEYDSEVNPLINEFKAVLKQGVQNMESVLPQFNLMQQYLLKKEFELIVDEATQLYSEIFKPTNDLVYKNYEANIELIENL